MAVDIFNRTTVLAINPTSATAGGTITSALIDSTLSGGHSSLTIDIGASTTDVVSNSPSVLKLSEADDTNATSFTDVTAFVGGGTGGFTIPNGSTATTNAVYATFEVDLRGRKRYLKVTISPRTTQTYFAVASFGRSKRHPVSTTDRNCAVVVTG